MVFKQMDSSARRKGGENFKDYKKRLRIDRKFLDRRLKGVLIWNSQTQGTMRRGSDE